MESEISAAPEAAAPSATASEAAPATSAPTDPNDDTSSDEEPEEPKPVPYDDLIKFPDEEPPPPELWENIEIKYKWERKKRGYIFEERLAKADKHKVRRSRPPSLAERARPKALSVNCQGLRRIRRHTGSWQQALPRGAVGTGSSPLQACNLLLSL